MADNEIIEALKCCKSAVASCEECPMYVEGVVCHGYELNEKALDLITRQQLEIERLKCEMGKLLPKDCAYAVQMEVSNKLETQIRAEAVREFAERLKAKSFKTIRNYGLTKDVVEVCDIDNLVKEMVGDTE